MDIFRWDFLVATFRNGMGFTDQLAIETAVPGEDFNHVSSSRSSVRALVRLVAERSRAGRPSLYSEEDCASGDRHRDTVRGRRVTLREGGRSPFSSEAGEGVPTLNVAKYATFYMGHPTLRGGTGSGLGSADLPRRLSLREQNLPAAWVVEFQDANQPICAALCRDSCARLPRPRCGSRIAVKGFRFQRSS